MSEGSKKDLEDKVLAMPFDQEQKEQLQRGVRNLTAEEAADAQQKLASLQEYANLVASASVSTEAPPDSVEPRKRLLPQPQSPTQIVPPPNSSVAPPKNEPTEKDLRRESGLAMIPRVASSLLLILPLGALLFAPMFSSLHSARDLPTQLTSSLAPVVSFLTFAALLVVAVTAHRRTARISFLALAGGAMVTAFVAQYSPEYSKWMWVLAALPSAMMVQHAVFLGMVRRPSFSKTIGKNSKEIEAGPGPWVSGEQVARASARYFNPEVLAIRYGVPAFLTAAIVVSGFTVLFAKEFPFRPLITPSWQASSAARLGFVGAYVYVLLYLGQRSFRHDITATAATWSALNLALGPIVAMALSYVWLGKSNNSTDVSASVIFLLAGLAPRHVVGVVEEMARRVWLTRPEPVKQGATIIPLSEVLGMSASAEERLVEEGITDAAALAMADPLKLMRNTSFDKRRILDWIDRALLMVTLPDTWKDLAKLGITGAIDLAWLSDKSAATLHSRTATRAEVIQLAAQTNIKDPVLLANVIDRLHEDAQVGLIWVLYQYDDSDSDDN